MQDNGRNLLSVNFRCGREIPTSWTPQAAPTSVLVVPCFEGTNPAPWEDITWHILAHPPFRSQLSVGCKSAAGPATGGDPSECETQALTGPLPKVPTRSPWHRGPDVLNFNYALHLALAMPAVVCMRRFLWSYVYVQMVASSLELESSAPLHSSVEGSKHVTTAGGCSILMPRHRSQTLSRMPVQHLPCLCMPCTTRNR